MFGVFQVVKLMLPVDIMESGVLVSAESYGSANMKPDPNAARRALIDAGVKRFKALAKSSDPGAPGIPGCSLYP